MKTGKGKEEARCRERDGRGVRDKQKEVERYFSKQENSIANRNL